jgi:hypothetical protein
MYGADEAAATLLRCVRLAPRGLHNGREARRPEASTLATSCGAGVERGHVAVALAQRLELLDEVRHEAAAPSQHQVVFDEHRPRVQPRRDELLPAHRRHVLRRQPLVDLAPLLFELSEADRSPPVLQRQPPPRRLRGPRASAQPLERRLRLRHERPLHLRSGRHACGRHARWGFEGGDAQKRRRCGAHPPGAGGGGAARRSP